MCKRFGIELCKVLTSCRYRRVTSNWQSDGSPITAVIPPKLDRHTIFSNVSARKPVIEYRLVSNPRADLDIEATFERNAPT